jgi:hypothetical protein
VSTAKQAADHFRAANERCAAIIAADTVKFPPGSLPAVWAGLMLANAAPTVHGPLLERRAA